MVTDGTLEVDESLLTGESDAIIKTSGSTLLSGSFVISGKAYAKVIHAGSDNYASKLWCDFGRSYSKKHKRNFGLFL